GADGRSRTRHAVVRAPIAADVLADSDDARAWRELLGGAHHWVRRHCRALCDDDSTGTESWPDSLRARRLRHCKATNKLNLARMILIQVATPPNLRTMSNDGTIRGEYS